MAGEASRTMLYRIAHVLEGRDDSVSYALDRLAEYPEDYDVLTVEKQLERIGFIRCQGCHTLLQRDNLKGDLCGECY